MIELLVSRLKHVPNLCAAYLFGSRARGTDGPKSDVDVGIWLTSAPRTFDESPFELAGELERVVGTRVDLVVMNDAPSDLVHRILRDSLLLLEPDRSARIALEVRARAHYFDMAAIRSQYRQARSA